MWPCGTIPYVIVKILLKSFVGECLWHFRCLCGVQVCEYVYVNSRKILRTKPQKYANTYPHLAAILQSQTASAM